MRSSAGLVALIVGLGLAVAASPSAAPAQSAGYEVWLIDQADAARGGARLYIFDGAALEAGRSPAPEVVNLDAAATGVGDGPGVRPHLVHFNVSFSHGVIANVATGHVYVIRASDRKIVASVDVGEQAHHAEVSPDGAYIIVANQNGKRLARIRADFSSERFSYNRSEDLDLGALQTPGQPDNAPICPYLTADRAYVTLRGGGLYIVDYRATPMRVVQSYTREQVAPAGCGATSLGDRIYVNSGAPTLSDLYIFSGKTHTLDKRLNFAWSGADAHGLARVGTYIWMNNRADGNVVIVSPTTGGLAGYVPSVGGTPDIMAAAPSGGYVFVAIRGPNNLTGGPTAKGVRPGLAVLAAGDGGRNGRLLTFIPMGDQTALSPNDPHAVAVRRK